MVIVYGCLAVLHYPQFFVFSLLFVIVLYVNKRLLISPECANRKSASMRVTFFFLLRLLYLAVILSLIITYYIQPSIVVGRLFSLQSLFCHSSLLQSPLPPYPASIFCILSLLPLSVIHHYHHFFPSTFANTLWFQFPATYSPTISLPPSSAISSLPPCSAIIPYFLHPNFPSHPFSLQSSSIANFFS